MVLTLKQWLKLAEMEFEDAFETAYSYLMQAGLDPDELLTSFIEEE